MLLPLTLSCLNTASMAAVLQGGFAAGPELISRQDTPDPEGPQQPLLNSKTCFNPINRQSDRDYYDCPPKLKMDETGLCDGLGKSNQPRDCAAYCEVRQSYRYGQEMPFDQSKCGPGPCKLTGTATAQNSNTFSVEVGISAGQDANAFKAGVSWAFTESKSAATGFIRDKPKENEEDCGYWAFVPYIVSSCGSLSKGTFSRENYVTLEFADCLDVATTPNYCQETNFIGVDGNLGGEAVFVATDCDKGTPMPFCKQSPVFLRAGVAQDPSVYNDYLLAHSNVDINEEILSTAQVQCEKGNWPPPS